MKTIWKYPLSVTHRQTIKAPRGSKFLSVVMQDRTLVAYFLVDPEVLSLDTEEHHFLILGTGQAIKDRQLEHFAYVGTVAQSGGMLMWHIFKGEE